MAKRFSARKSRARDRALSKSKGKKTSAKVSPVTEESVDTDTQQALVTESPLLDDEMRGLASAAALMTFAESLEDVSKLQGYATVGAAILALLVVGVGSLQFTRWREGHVPLANEWVYMIVFWCINLGATCSFGFMHVSYTAWLSARPGRFVLYVTTVSENAEAHFHALPPYTPQSAFDPPTAPKLHYGWRFSWHGRALPMFLCIAM